MLSHPEDVTYDIDAPIVDNLDIEDPNMRLLWYIGKFSEKLQYGPVSVRQQREAEWHQAVMRQYDWAVKEYLSEPLPIDDVRKAFATGHALNQGHLSR